VLALTIAGVDQTALLQAGTLRLASRLNARDTAAFVLTDLTGAYRPAVGAAVVITNNGAVAFAGTVDDLTETTPVGVPGALVSTVNCVDYNQLCDRHLVAAVYLGQTLGAIVGAIVAAVLAGEGVTTAHVEAGPTITKAVFSYQSVTDCFNALANLTGYAWYLDSAKDLHFFARGSNPAPLSLTDTSGNFFGLAVRSTRQQYRNRQYLRAGFDTTTPRTESFAGDAKRRTFAVGYPLAAVPTITVNGSAKTVGIKGVDTDKDWYWNKASADIVQDAAGALLASTDTLAVTYQGLFPLIVSADASTEIAARAAAEGGSGVYEALVTDQSIDTRALATDTATGLLRRYGTITQVVSFSYEDPDDATGTGRLAAGQLLSVNVSAHNLAGSFLIDSVSAVDVGGAYLRYQVQALSGESLGSWEDFFAQLVTAGQTYVIRDNEVLLLLRSLPDALVLADTLTSTTAPPTTAQVGMSAVGFCEVGP
jgi:hypothetical protein